MTLQETQHPFEPVAHGSPEMIQPEGEELPTLLNKHRSDLSHPESPSSEYVTSKEILGLSKVKQPRRRPFDNRGTRCRAGICPCRCRQQLSLRWRFLSFSFSDTSSFMSPCNHHECKGCNIQLCTQIRIAYWNISFALLTSLDISWAPGGLSISPVLRVKRLVDYDSAGFRIVRNYREYKSSLVETARALNQAFDSGEASRLDSTRYDSLIDAILEISWLYRGHSAVECLQLLDMIGLRYDLLDSFMFNTYFKVAFLEEDVDFLEAIDQTDIIHYISSIVLDQLPFYRWPLRSVGRLDDPFHMDVMKQWITRCPGFGDIPGGIERIMTGQTYRSSRHTDVLSVPVEEQWLGLSALFWSTADAPTLRVLLAQSHDPNSMDRKGRTPIFYAAAYGKVDCVMMLLEAGVRPDVYDEQSRNFLLYAMENDHPNVAIESLEYLRTAPACSDEMYERLLHENLFFACENATIKDVSTLQSFVRLGANVNSLNSAGQTLCHVLSLPAHAQVLFNHGFNHLNMPGRWGRSCLHTAAKACNVPLLRFYLNKGARLQEIYGHGRNALHISLASLDYYFERTNSHAWYSTVRTLIAYGVNVLARDNCRCACSRAGCSPVKALSTSFCFRTTVYSTCILSIEYLMLLEEMVGTLPAEESLSELIRFYLFEEFELTHVCCNGYTKGSRIQDDDEISEIQDEEGLLTDQLDEEVDAVLERSLGRTPAEFWEEFLLDSIATPSRSMSAQHKHQDTLCTDVFCLEYWYKDLSRYSDFIIEVYGERFNDETLHDLDDTWLQKRKSMIQRCYDKIASIKSSRKHMPSAAEGLSTLLVDQSTPYDRDD